MTYLAAAVQGDTRARFFDVLSMNGLAQVAAKYPNTTVIFADKTQRAKTAPSVDKLFGLLVSRAKPMATETGWHRCSLTAARKLIVNVLENREAEIKTFDSAHARAGDEVKAESEATAAKEKAKAEAGAKTKATKATAEADTHGYVYAFSHKANGWLKVGMTSKSDEARCWNRINHYIKAHSLPSRGWEFVGFIASTDAQKLESLIHRRLAGFRVVNGKATELFSCSIDAYMAALDALQNHIDKSSPHSAHNWAKYEAAKAAEAEARAKREAAEKAAKAARQAREAAEREACRQMAAPLKQQLKTALDQLNNIHRDYKTATDTSPIKPVKDALVATAVTTIFFGPLSPIVGVFSYRDEKKRIAERARLAADLPRIEAEVTRLKSQCVELGTQLFALGEGQYGIRQVFNEAGLGYDRHEIFRGTAIESLDDPTNPAAKAAALTRALRVAEERAAREAAQAIARAEAEANVKQKAHKYREALDNLVSKLPRYEGLQRWDVIALASEISVQKVETINRVKQRGPLNDKLNSVWLGKERIRRAIANNERAIDEAVLEMALLEDVKRRKVWEKENPSGCFSDQHYLFARPSGLSDADLVTIASRNPVNVVTLRNISALHWSSEWKAALVRLRCSDITYVGSKGQ